MMQQAHSRPESTAFSFHEDVWTYRRLADKSERVARGLAANGVKAGDRVVLHMTNRPEMLVAYYACFRLGAIAAPFRTAFTFAELAPMIKRLERSALHRRIGALSERCCGRCFDTSAEEALSR